MSEVRVREGESEEAELAAIVEGRGGEAVWLDAGWARRMRVVAMIRDYLERNLDRLLREAGAAPTHWKTTKWVAQMGRVYLMAEVCREETGIYIDFAFAEDGREGLLVHEPFLTILFEKI